MSQARHSNRAGHKEGDRLPLSTLFWQPRGDQHSPLTSSSTTLTMCSRVLKWADIFHLPISNFFPFSFHCVPGLWSSHGEESMALGR
jgi:hypothetical protein